MVKEAIVLAGGLGTRLRKILKDVPKPMADINGKPFLEYLLLNLEKNGIEKVILAVGYKYEVIKDYFGEKFNSLQIKYSIENKLLGTGGGIKKALSLIEEEDVYVFNGDTFFDINLEKFYEFHKSKRAKISIALKAMQNFNRYGTVMIDKDFRIVGFEEKKFRKVGFINSGIYLLNTPFFNFQNLPLKFSFEKDFLEVYYKDFEFYGFPFEGYFIDIGVPEDYERAREDFKKFKNQ